MEVPDVVVGFLESAEDIPGDRVRGDDSQLSPSSHIDTLVELPGGVFL